MKNKIIALALAAICFGSAAAPNVMPAQVIAADSDTAQTVKNMTLDDVQELSKKGKKLDWSDFSGFNVKWRSTIAYSRFAKIELGNDLFLVVGGEPNYRPEVVWLCYKDTETYVDVKTGDVSAFISKYAKTDTVTTTKAATTTTTAKTTTTTAKATTTTAKTTTTTAKTTTTAAKTTTVTTSVTTLLATVKGDANCDGQMDMADVVLIMQAMANPNKYGIDGTAEHHLTEQGKINSDMDGNGLTVGDALAIQRKLLGIEECEKLTIKLNTLIPQNGSEYVEMKADETMVSSYDQASSSLNGMGVWFKFESPKYPVTVSTENGKFRIFNYKGGGLGSVDEVGKSYTVGRSGEVCFAPENGKLSDDYKAEVKVTGEENGKTVDLGTLVIIKTDKNTKGVLSVTFKKTGSASLAGKKFYYEKEGFGGYCNIEFNEDGTFLYSPGVLSSYLGGGTWKISGDTVILTEKNEGEGKTITNRFKIAGNDIVYIADGSDGLRYMEVKDGEKFSITAADTSDLEIIRQQLSDFFTAEKIDYSVIPRDKMPEQFADKYVFIQVNTADTSYAARYGAFLKSSDIDSSLIKSIPYKIDSDTELNKIRALLYCYILENNINASIDPTDEEADLKNKTVLVKYADSEKTRTQLENFLKEKNIDLKLVEFFAVE